MARTYLETSFVSACVGTRTNLRSQYERAVSQLWWQQQGPQHELFISAEVLSELNSPSYPQREDAIRFIAEVPSIEITPLMRAFAVQLAEAMVMPRPVGGDALHVAVAVVARMEYLLTWNVKHLANPNKVLHLSAVCAERAYLAPKILRPDDLVELPS